MGDMVFSDFLLTGGSWGLPVLEFYFVLSRMGFLCRLCVSCGGYVEHDLCGAGEGGEIVNRRDST